jgi:hypothetical protein
MNETFSRMIGPISAVVCFTMFFAIPYTTDAVAQNSIFGTIEKVKEPSVLVRWPDANVKIGDKLFAISEESASILIEMEVKKLKIQDKSSTLMCTVISNPAKIDFSKLKKQKVITTLEATNRGEQLNRGPIRMIVQQNNLNSQAEPETELIRSSLLAVNPSLSFAFLIDREVSYFASAMLGSPIITPLTSSKVSLSGFIPPIGGKKLINAIGIEYLQTISSSAEIEARTGSSEVLQNLDLERTQQKFRLHFSYPGNNPLLNRFGFFLNLLNRETESLIQSGDSETNAISTSNTSIEASGISAGLSYEAAVPPAFVLGLHIELPTTQTAKFKYSESSELNGTVNSFDLRTYFGPRFQLAKGLKGGTVEVLGIFGYRSVQTTIKALDLSDEAKSTESSVFGVRFGIGYSL